MKNSFWLILLLLPITAFKGPQADTSFKNFDLGEVMKFKVHYGFVNAGEAVMTIDKKIHQYNNRPCYKMEVEGRSVGFFDLITTIRDTWGSYVDTATLVPYKFYRDIREAKYRKKETTLFKRDIDSAFVYDLDKKTNAVKKVKKYKTPENVQDMVSGYYFMRTFDFDEIAKGEIVTIPGFFEDEVYNLKVRFLGREELDTRIGKFTALKLAPIMPKNSLFEGEDSIVAWISDDDKRIPLKIKARMFVGAVEIDIRSYQAGSR